MTRPAIASVRAMNAPASRAERVHNLPHLASSFVGRAHEVARVAELLAGARLVVDAGSLLLVEVAYTDREGGRSRFVLSGHGPLGEDGRFSPPEGIVWQDG